MKETLETLFNFTNKYFLFGDRWILLIPIFFLIIWFYFIDKIYDSLNFKETIKKPIFWIPIILSLILCIISYKLLPYLPPPEDEFVLAITDFKAVSDDSKTESRKLKDRLIENIKHQQKKLNVDVSIKSLSETIDPISDEEIELAKQLAKRNRAHLIICGKVRYDEEYFFEPIIINLTNINDIYEISQSLKPLIVEPGVLKTERLRLKKQKIGELTDFVTFILGMIKYDSSNFKRAIDIFNGMQKATAESYYYIGNAFTYMDEYEIANSYFDKVIMLKPNLSSPWTNKGFVLDALGKSDEALEAFNKAIELNPEDPLNWFNKGCNLSDKNEFNEALEAFNMAIELIPDFIPALLNKGLASLYLGRFDGAIIEFNKAIELVNDPFAWNNKGLALLGLGKYNEALEAFNMAIELIPTYAQAWMNKGIVLDNLGNFEKAIVAYDNAIELDPKDSAILYNKSLAYSRSGRIDEAIDTLKKVLKIKPDYAEAYYLLAVNYLHDNDELTALKNLSEAIKLKSGVKEVAKTDEIFDVLHSNNDFKELVK